MERKRHSTRTALADAKVLLSAGRPGPSAEQREPYPLVPVFIDIDRDNVPRGAVHEHFLWRLEDPQAVPEVAALKFCFEISIPNSYDRNVEQQIERCIKRYRKASSRVQEHLVVIELSVKYGDLEYHDKLVWDVNGQANFADRYVCQVGAELGLSWPHTKLLIRALEDKLEKLKKEQKAAASTSQPTDGTAFAMETEPGIVKQEDSTMLSTSSPPTSSSTPYKFVHTSLVRKKDDIPEWSPAVVRCAHQPKEEEVEPEVKPESMLPAVPKKEHTLGVAPPVVSLMSRIKFEIKPKVELRVKVDIKHEEDDNDEGDDMKDEMAAEYEEGGTVEGVTSIDKTEDFGEDSSEAGEEEEGGGQDSELPASESAAAEEEEDDDDDDEEEEEEEEDEEDDE